MSVLSQCPDCGGRMEEGFIPDATYGQILQTHWHPGEPEKSTFLGMNMGTKIDRSGFERLEAEENSRRFVRW